MKDFCYGVLAGMPIGAFLLGTAIEAYFVIGQWLYERKSKSIEMSMQKSEKR